jgi:hypothetical protein
MLNVMSDDQDVSEEWQRRLFKRRAIMWPLIGLGVFLGVVAREAWIFFFPTMIAVVLWLQFSQKAFSCPNCDRQIRATLISFCPHCRARLK